jgi:hypothetical protein
MSIEPITGLTYQEAGSRQTDALQNAEVNYYGAWLNPVVLAVGQAAPTGSEVNGDRYIVGVGTGLFAGWDNRLAVKRGGAWVSYVPLAAGVPLVKDLASGDDYEFVSGAWAAKSGGGGASAWGSITGTLSAQTDLQAALDAKLALAGGSLTGALNEAKGADIASGGTTNIASATGNFVHITGTSAITGFGTAQAGTRRVLVFDGALLLTHNATSLILPTAANINTVAGDTATMVSEGSGNWRCTSYQRKDGTSLASGGGSLTNFTEAVNTATPNASVPVASLTVNNGATNADMVLAPKGGGAYLRQVPDNTTTGGNKRGFGALDFQRSRSAAAQVASGADAVILASVNSTAAGDRGVVLASSAGSASNTGTAAIAATSSTASGSGAVVIASNTSTASGTNSFATGNNTTASGSNSIAHGANADTRSIQNARAFGSGIAGKQGLEVNLNAATTNATPTVLTCSSSATPSATNQLVLPSNRSAYVTLKLVARQSAGTGTVGDSAAWNLRVLVKNIAGTMSIVGLPPVAAEFADTGATTWAISLSVNNTLKTLEVTFTGEASKTIQVDGIMWAAEA